MAILPKRNTALSGFVMESVTISSRVCLVWKGTSSIPENSDMLSQDAFSNTKCLRISPRLISSGSEISLAGTVRNMESRGSGVLVDEIAMKETGATGGLKTITIAIITSQPLLQTQPIDVTSMVTGL